MIIRTLKRMGINVVNFFTSKTLHQFLAVFTYTVAVVAVCMLAAWLTTGGVYKPHATGPLSIIYVMFVFLFSFWFYWAYTDIKHEDEFNDEMKSIEDKYNKDLNAGKSNDPTKH